MKKRRQFVSPTDCSTLLSDVASVLKTNMINPQNGSKYFQSMYPTQEFYLVFIKNSFNLAIIKKKHPILKWVQDLSIHFSKEEASKHKERYLIP